MGNQRAEQKGLKIESIQLVNKSLYPNYLINSLILKVNIRVVRNQLLREIMYVILK